jgi:hypothetical protein
MTGNETDRDRDDGEPTVNGHAHRHAQRHGVEGLPARAAAPDPAAPDPAAPAPAPAAAGHEPESVAAMPDRPPMRRVWLVLLALTLLIVGVSVGVSELVKVVGDRLTTERAGVRDALLGELRARDEAALGSYEQLDAAAGRYRVPIDRATERLLADPGLLKPLAEPPKEPAPGEGDAPEAGQAPAPGGGE